MNQGKSILKNTLIYALGNFGSKVLAFLLLPLYSYYLTKDEFGTYDVFLVTISFLSPILSLQIMDAAYRWLIDVKDDINKTKTIIVNGFVIITILSAFFVLIFMIILRYKKIEYSGYFLLLLLTGLYVPYFQKVLRGLGKNMKYAISGILYTFLLLSLNILLLTVLHLKVESLFIASIIANLFILIYVLFQINIKGIFNFKNFDRKEAENMIKYSMPLVPNAFSWWLINASDKYLILYFIGLEANGIYAISTRFPAIIMLLNSVFLMAWQDHGISGGVEKKDMEFYSKLFNKFIILEMTVVLFLIAISPYLIKYLISPDYIEAWKYLPLLFIGTAFSAFAAFVGVGYQRNKKTKGILITSLIGGIVNFITSYFLIPIIGLYAPALGTLISFLVVYILRKRETNTFFKINVDNKLFMFLILISLFFSYLVTINNIYLNTGLVIFSIIILIIFNKEIITKILKVIKGHL